MATFSFTLTDEQKTALINGVLARWPKDPGDPQTGEEYAQTMVKQLCSQVFAADLVTILRCPAAHAQNLIDATLFVRPMSPEHIAAGGTEEEWVRLTIRAMALAWYSNAREQLAASNAPEPEIEDGAVEHL